MKYTLLLSFVFALLIFASCSKDANGLPSGETEFVGLTQDCGARSYSFSGHIKLSVQQETFSTDSIRFTTTITWTDFSGKEQTSNVQLQRPKGTMASVVVLGNPTQAQGDYVLNFTIYTDPDAFGNVSAIRYLVYMHWEYNANNSPDTRYEQNMIGQQLVC